MFASFEDLINNQILSPTPIEFCNSLSTAEYLQQLHTLIKNILDNKDKEYDDIIKDFEQKFSEFKEKYEETNDINFNKYLGTLKNYCYTYINDIIGESLKFVQFGLENGYLVIYIPDNWKNLNFSTIMDIESADYGKLVIEME